MERTNSNLTSWFKMKLIDYQSKCFPNCPVYDLIGKKWNKWKIWNVPLVFSLNRRTFAKKLIDYQSKCFPKCPVYYFFWNKWIKWLISKRPQNVPFKKLIDYYPKYIPNRPVYDFFWSKWINWLLPKGPQDVLQNKTYLISRQAMDWLSV